MLCFCLQVTSKTFFTVYPVKCFLRLPNTEKNYQYTVVKLAGLAYVCSKKSLFAFQSFLSVNEQNELQISTHMAFCYYIIRYAWPHTCGIVYLQTSNSTNRRQPFSNAVLKLFYFIEPSLIICK